MTKGRREKGFEWVRRGRLAVRVPVEVVYPQDDPHTPCLEPRTLQLLDEVVRRAEAGDVEYLKTVGEVFEQLPA